MRQSEHPSRAGHRGSLRNPGLSYRLAEGAFNLFDLAAKGLHGLLILTYVVGSLVTVGLLAWWVLVAIF